MRHLWSFLAGLVAAPLTWGLLAAGQSGSTRTVEAWETSGVFDGGQLIRPAAYLATAAVVLGLIATLRVSPLGPLVAGAALTAAYAVLFIRPFGLLDRLPHSAMLLHDAMPLDLPLRNGTLGFVGMMLLMAVLSVQRWRRWPVTNPADEAAPTGQVPAADEAAPTGQAPAADEAAPTGQAPAADAPGEPSHAPRHAVAPTEHAVAPTEAEAPTPGVDEPDAGRPDSGEPDPADPVSPAAEAARPTIQAASAPERPAAEPDSPVGPAEPTAPPRPRSSRRVGDPATEQGSPWSAPPRIRRTANE